MAISLTRLSFIYLKIKNIIESYLILLNIKLGLDEKIQSIEYVCIFVNSLLFLDLKEKRTFFSSQKQNVHGLRFIQLRKRL